MRTTVKRMKSRVQQRIVVAMLAVLVAAVYLAGLRRSDALMAERARPHGQYNYEQIVTHSKLPAFELFGDAAKWQLTGYSEIIFNRQGVRTHIWNVVCTDLTGKDLGLFSWNSDTGDLMHFSDRTRPTVKQPLKPISAAEATTQAKSWLRELCYREDASKWKLSAAPVHRVNAWLVQFAGNHGAADLRIDAKSGRLLSYHLSQS